MRVARQKGVFSLNFSRMLKKIAVRILEETYLIAMVIALLVGIFVPQAKILASLSTLILQIIFFISCLKIDPKSVLEHLKDWRFLALANFVMLIVFPVLVYLAGAYWKSDFAFAIFLLAAMPVGMTVPLLVDIAGGRHSIAVVLTVTTSLLAPFSIPLLTKFLYGADVNVDAGAMFVQLAKVIFLPFLLAMVARAAWAKGVNAVKARTKHLSIVLLGLLIAGAVAKQSHEIASAAANWPAFLLTIAGLYVFFLALHASGYHVFWWKEREIKQTSSIALTYMNFTLAIFLAGQFFPRPGIILPLVFSIIPWATLMPLWLRISGHNKAS
jgi:predicted Na+-dependent transporter